MALMTQTSEWKEFQFFQHLARLDQIARFAPWPAVTKADDRKALGRRVEAMAAELVADRGWPVQLTGEHDAFDLWAGGARVEVKAARFYVKRGRGGRYQAAVRNWRADLVLMACVGDDAEVWAWFVIPASAIGTRRNLAIWSIDPRAYAGQWAEYLEAWHLVDEVAEAAGPHPGQLALLL